MVEIEVRCCCTPTKLYGYMQVPAERARSGRRFTWEALRLAMTGAEIAAAEKIDLTPAVVVVQMELCEYIDGGERRLAFKMDGEEPPGEKLAKLMRLREFRPA